MPLAFQLIARVKFLAQDIDHSQLDDPTKRRIMAALVGVATLIEPNVDELNQDYASKMIRQIGELTP